MHCPHPACYRPPAAHHLWGHTSSKQDQPPPAVPASCASLLPPPWPMDARCCSPLPVRLVPRAAAAGCQTTRLMPATVSCWGRPGSRLSSGVAAYQQEVHADAPDAAAAADSVPAVAGAARLHVGALAYDALQGACMCSKHEAASALKRVHPRLLAHGQHCLQGVGAQANRECKQPALQLHSGSGLSTWLPSSGQRAQRAVMAEVGGLMTAAVPAVAVAPRAEWPSRRRGTSKAISLPNALQGEMEDGRHKARRGRRSGKREHRPARARHKSSSSTRARERWARRSELSSGGTGARAVAGAGPRKSHPCPPSSRAIQLQTANSLAATAGLCSRPYSSVSSLCMIALIWACCVLYSMTTPRHVSHVQLTLRTVTPPQAGNTLHCLPHSTAATDKSMGRP